MANISDFQDRLTQITSHFGIDTQLIKLNEEMGELLNEGYKAIYKGENTENLTDEIADVMNVLLQVMLYFDLDWSKIQDRMEFKINRCIDRLNGDYYNTHSR